MLSTTFTLDVQSLLLLSFSLMALGWAIGSRITFERAKELAKPTNFHYR